MNEMRVSLAPVFRRGDLRTRHLSDLAMLKHGVNAEDEVI